MRQARRGSQRVGFGVVGELVEFGETETIFTKQTDKGTQEYQGAFG